jgi:hypothetical protein
MAKYRCSTSKNNNNNGIRTIVISFVAMMVIVAVSIIVTKITKTAKSFSLQTALIARLTF